MFTVQVLPICMIGGTRLLFIMIPLNLIIDIVSCNFIMQIALQGRKCYLYTKIYRCIFVYFQLHARNEYNMHVYIDMCIYILLHIYNIYIIYIYANILHIQSYLRLQILLVSNCERNLISRVCIVSIPQYLHLYT